MGSYCLEKKVKAKEFLKQEGLVDTVLSELNSIQVLPETGIVAGQSVASVLMRLFGKPDGVINDIDVYQFEDFDEQRHFDAPAPLRYISPDPYRLDDEGYGWMVSSVSNRVSIVDVAYEGVINKIFMCNYEKNYHDSDLVFLILNFDLNCVQVGIDLKTHDFFYMQAFVDFLDSFQLRVMGAHTPIMTALRLFKKLVEMPLYCHVEEEMKFLGMVLKNFTVVGTRSAIGPKTYNKYQKYIDSLAPYILLSPFTALRDEIPEGSQKDKRFLLYKGEVNPDFAKVIDDGQNFDWFGWNFDSWVLYHRLAFNSLTKGKKQQVEKLLSSYDTIKVSLLTQGVNYISERIDEKNLEIVDKGIWHTPEFFSSFIHNNFTIQKRYSKAVNSYKKKHPNYQITIGTDVTNKIGVKDPVYYISVFGVEVFYKVVNTELVIPREKIIEQNAYSLLWVDIEQIIDIKTLKSIGDRHHHCLGQMSLRLIENEDRRDLFFFIRMPWEKSEKRGSTLHLVKKTSPFGYQIFQHLGDRNTRVSLIHALLAIFITRRVNDAKGYKNPKIVKRVIGERLNIHMPIKQSFNLFAFNLETKVSLAIHRLRRGKQPPIDDSDVHHLIEDRDDIPYL